MLILSFFKKNITQAAGYYYENVLPTFQEIMKQKKYGRELQLWFLYLKNFTTKINLAFSAKKWKNDENNLTSLYFHK